MCVLVFSVLGGFFLFFLFFWSLRHMEVPGLGVEAELQVSNYTIATATPDPSLICDLHCSTQQPRILNPLIEARDRTQILTDTSQVHYCLATTGTPTLMLGHMSLGTRRENRCYLDSRWDS